MLQCYIDLVGYPGWDVKNETQHPTPIKTQSHSVHLEAKTMNGKLRMAFKVMSGQPELHAPISLLIRLGE